MKRILPSLAFITVLLFATVTFAQIAAHITHPAKSFPSESITPSSHSPASNGFHFSPLSSSISLPGVSLLSFTGTLQAQADAKALHNIQVDPSNPNKIHAVIMSTTDPSENDTATLYTRRCFYTFSNDGGKTWKAPVTFDTVRTGFPDMKLIRRPSDGQYIPMIAAHRVFNAGKTTPTDSLKIGLWIETGNPGDGKFAASYASMTDAYGKKLPGYGTGIIWPVIAFSPDTTTVYVAGAVSPGTVSKTNSTAIPDTFGIQFGSFALNANSGTASFNGWTGLPGSGDATLDSAGLTSGAEYAIDVSPSGKIGIVWKNGLADSTAKNGVLGGPGGLFFSESIDAGKTWTKQLSPMIPVGDPSTATTDAGSRLLPLPYIDFWFNGEIPRFVYAGVLYDFGSSSWYPGSSTIYFLDTATGTPVPVVGINSLAGAQQQMPNPFVPLSGANGPNTTVNQDQYNIDLFSFLTVGHTSDPNHFAIFFQSYELGDTEIMDVLPGAAFDGSDSTVTYPYSSIYYVETMDGGKTWGGVIPFQWNDAAISNGEGQHYDFRFPQVSSYNPLTSGTATYYTLFSVDTAAGYLVQNGIYGFDTISYGFATTAPLSGVSTNPQLAASVGLVNYPDPVHNSTTIQFTLPQAAHAVVTINDMLGRPIKTLADQFMGAGEHSLVFSAGALANGVYRYTLSTGDLTVSRSLTILH